ncbi:hypothetical protein JCM17380_16120 [Desulfosporosinus burensis]
MQCNKVLPVHYIPLILENLDPANHLRGLGFLGISGNAFVTEAEHRETPTYNKKWEFKKWTKLG